MQVVGLVLIDTLYPYWGPEGTSHADIPVDVLLGPCPPDMKDQILRCAEWSRLDCNEWVARNWKGNEDSLEGVEALEPPPAVRIHATKYVPVIENERGDIAMFDYSRETNGGWGDFFPHEFIVATLELDAHHFEILSPKNVSLKIGPPSSAVNFWLTCNRSSKLQRRSRRRASFWRKNKLYSSVHLTVSDQSTTSFYP